MRLPRNHHEDIDFGANIIVLGIGAIAALMAIRGAIALWLWLF